MPTWVEEEYGLEGGELRGVDAHLPHGFEQLVEHLVLLLVEPQRSVTLSVTRVPLSLPRGVGCPVEVGSRGEDESVETVVWTAEGVDEAGIGDGRVPEEGQLVVDGQPLVGGDGLGPLDHHHPVPLVPVVEVGVCRVIELRDDMLRRLKEIVF